MKLAKPDSFATHLVVRLKEIMPNDALDKFMYSDAMGVCVEACQRRTWFVIVKMANGNYAAIAKFD